MEKSYEAPKLLVPEGEVYESIAAGIASAVTSSATSSMTSCSVAQHSIDSELTAAGSTFKIRPLAEFQTPATVAATTKKVVTPAKPAKTVTGVHS